MRHQIFAHRNAHPISNRRPEERLDLGGLSRVVDWQAVYWRVVDWQAADSRAADSRAVDWQAVDWGAVD